MKSFNQLPKSIKKTIRYISQDITSLDNLEQLEKILTTTIKTKKQELRRLKLTD